MVSDLTAMDGRFLESALGKVSETEAPAASIKPIEVIVADDGKVFLEGKGSEVAVREHAHTSIFVVVVVIFRTTRDAHTSHF